MAILVLALVAIAVTASAAEESFEEREQRNYDKSEEREQHDWGTPDFQQRMRAIGSREQAALVNALAADPERQPSNVCGAGRQYGCLGDVRLWDWQENGHGIVRPFLFTARSGATLSGRMWATADGPPKRPAVVFVTGSIQVPEPPYWFVATTLAKRGYVVMTFDVQGQGLSDTYGEGADRNEGVPSQAGQPFFDGAEDALDFLLSTPTEPYRPRPSCSTGTNHSPKQERRAASGLNAAFNPLWQLVDPDRIGLAGQSFGALGASFVGQKDPRVDAIAALDNLSEPTTVSLCPSAPDSRELPNITKPAIGISNDYSISPQPYQNPPDPDSKSGASRAYSEAGVPSAQINIRGGTHQECAFIPMSFTRATLRGVDLCAWHVAAWFDRYVKGDPTADRRLLSRRWLADARDVEVDPAGGGNLLSFHFLSRVDLRLAVGSRRVVCEDLRAGCRDLTRYDGWRGGFHRLTLALSKDGRRGARAYEPRLRGRRAAIPQRVAIRRRRHSIRVGPRGGNPAEIDRYQLQVRGRRGWRRTRSARNGRFRTTPRAVRARAIDRLEGAGPWRVSPP